MAKQKLKIVDEPFEYNFTVVAIVSQSRDYHLCWQINRELGMNLKRERDLQISDVKKQQMTYFSYYSFSDDNDMSRVHLVGNKSGSHLFLPEVKLADFLLVVNEKTEEETKKIILALKKMQQVLAVTKLDVIKLKSKKNLIFE